MAKIIAANSAERLEGAVRPAARVVSAVSPAAANRCPALGRRRVRPVFDAVVKAQLLANVDVAERVEVDAFGTAVLRGGGWRRHEVPVLARDL